MGVIGIPRDMRTPIDYKATPAKLAGQPFGKNRPSKARPDDQVIVIGAHVSNLKPGAARDSLLSASVTTLLEKVTIRECKATPASVILNRRLVDQWSKLANK